MGVSIFGCLTIEIWGIEMSYFEPSGLMWHSLTINTSAEKGEVYNSSLCWYLGNSWKREHGNTRNPSSSFTQNVAFANNMFSVFKMCTWPEVTWWRWRYFKELRHDQKIFNWSITLLLWKNFNLFPFQRVTLILVFPSSTWIFCRKKKIIDIFM